MKTKQWMHCLLCKGTGVYKSIITGKPSRCGQCHGGLVCKQCLRPVIQGTVVFTAKSPAYATAYIRCDRCSWGAVA